MGNGERRELLAEREQLTTEVRQRGQKQPSQSALVLAK